MSENCWICGKPPRGMATLESWDTCEREFSKWQRFRGAEMRALDALTECVRTMGKLGTSYQWVAYGSWCPDLNSRQLRAGIESPPPLHMRWAVGELAWKVNSAGVPNEDNVSDWFECFDYLLRWLHTPARLEDVLADHDVQPPAGMYHETKACPECELTLAIPVLCHPRGPEIVHPHPLGYTHVICVGCGYDWREMDPEELGRIWAAQLMHEREQYEEQ